MKHDDQFEIERVRRILEGYGWTVKTTDCCDEQIIITIILKKGAEQK